MKIQCFTKTEDLLHEKWPTSTEGEPLVGDSMESESGKRLKVVARTWLPDGSLRIELQTLRRPRLTPADRLNALT